MRLDTIVRVETPEGITLSLRPAGAVVRGLAFVIDLLIRIVLVWIASMLLGQLKGFGFGLFLVLLFGVEWFYPVAFQMSRRAATPGQRALGLRVVMDDGLPLTLSAALLRNLLRTVDFLPFMYAAGVLSMLWRSDFKRLGDIVAGTLVVHSDSVRLAGALPAAEPLAPRIALTRARQVAILHLAGRAARLTPERLDELAVLAEDVLPPPDLAPGRASPPPIRPGPRLLAVAQWLAGQR